MEPLSSKDLMAMHDLISKDFARQSPPAAPAQPAPPPPPTPPTYTLQQKGTHWLLTGPNGTTKASSYKNAISLVAAASSDGGSDVRLLDEVGLIYKVVHVPPALKAQPPKEAPSRPKPAAAPAARQATRVPPPPFRLFLQEQPSSAPYMQWGDWKVRPWGSDYLEVEASAAVAGTPVSVVAYLVAAENHSGINSCAMLGGMLNSLLEQRQKILTSAPAQAALQASGCLRPLIESESVNDAGLGWCSLKFVKDTTDYSQSLLIWTDNQPSELSPSPHTRFLVQRTFHIALELISELLMLQQALTANHVPQAQSVWDQTDNTLDWLDVNLARAGRILNVLAEIFG